VNAVVISNTDSKIRVCEQRFVNLSYIKLGCNRSEIKVTSRWFYFAVKIIKEICEHISEYGPWQGEVLIKQSW
jgi:hypothetical protein